MEKIKIAIDTTGGDNAPFVPINAGIEYARNNKNVIIYLYGKEIEIKPLIPKDILNKQIFIKNANEKIDPNAKDISLILRKDNDIALFRAMKEASLYDAVVSAGPTQAVVAGGHFLVGRLPRIRRIAFAPILTNFSGKEKLLFDAGANVMLTPEQIVDLGIIGTAFARVLFNIKNPRLGLLNIGSEETKGRDFEVEAYKLLRENDKINFIGNVEPNEAISDDFEIILSDGYSGNIFLKTLEAFYKGLKIGAKEQLFKGLSGAFGYLFLRRKIKKLGKKMSPKNVGGAILLGTKKVIVKIHGNSDMKTFYNGIGLSERLAKGSIIKKLEEELKNDK